MSSMRYYRMFAVVFVLFIGIVVQTAVCETAVSAQSPITFSDEYTENDFPNGLTFNITATAVEGDVVSAKLYYKVRNGVSTAQKVIAVEPANQVDLHYVWDTSNLTITPSTAVFYHWEVVDSAGNRVKSEEQLVYYDDVRYEWHVLEDDDIAVWQHDRPKQFGETVFTIAQRAIAEQKTVFQTDLDYQIRIILYNDFDEFAGWHAYVNEFIGGQAFPAQGVTTQIVESNGYTEQWLNDVIPHEISHLYMYQASTHPLSHPPAWLNEGVAQYNEFTPNQYVLDYVQAAADAGELLRLYSLSGSFGNDEDQVRLSYAESLSAVVYLMETYGEEGLKNLLAAYKNGESNDDALMTGLGVSILEFEQGWMEWLGVPRGTYPPPTAVPTHAAVPTVGMMMPPTRKPTATATLLATATSEAMMTETAVSPSATPVQLPLISTPEPTAVSPAPTSSNSNSICATAILPLLAVGFIWKRKDGL